MEPFTSLSDEVDGEKEGTDEEDAKEEPAEEKPTTEVLEPVNIKDIPLPDSEQLSVDLVLCLFLFALSLCVCVCVCEIQCPFVVMPQWE